MSIQGFIFDLDGTLLDSMAIWDGVGEEYLRSLGVRDIPAGLGELIRPMSLADASEYFRRQFELPLTAGQVADGINATIEDRYRDIVPLKDGVKEFLEAYKDHPMCVATATDRHLVQAALERLGVDGYFRFIITSTEVGSSKQNPEIYLQAARRLGFEPGQVAVFEDAVHAVRTAKEAGFYVVGVWDPSSDAASEQIRQASDDYIRSLKEYGGIR